MFAKVGKNIHKPIIGGEKPKLSSRVGECVDVRVSGGETDTFYQRNVGHNGLYEQGAARDKLK